MDNNKELFQLIKEDRYSDYKYVSNIIEGDEEFAKEVVEYKNYASSLCVFCWEYRIEKVPEDFDTSKFYIINKENFNFCNDDIFNMAEQEELKEKYGMYIPRDSRYYELIKKEVYIDFNNTSSWESVINIINGTKEFAEKVMEYKRTVDKNSEYEIKQIDIENPFDKTLVKFYVINEENFTINNPNIFSNKEKEILETKYGCDREYSMYEDDNLSFF